MAVVEKATRRQLLIGTGVVAASGITVATLSNKTTATVSATEFAIPNKEKILADTDTQDVLLAVSVGYAFSSNADITGLKLRLKVGTSQDSAELIGRTSVDNLGTTETSGSTELKGSLLSSGDFSKSNFNPESGSITTDIVAVLEMDVLRNGEIIKTVSNTDTASITVSAEEVTVDASVGGEGEISFETA